MPANISELGGGTSKSIELVQCIKQSFCRSYLQGLSVLPIVTVSSMSEKFTPFDAIVVIMQRSKAYNKVYSKLLLLLKEKIFTARPSHKYMTG